MRERTIYYRSILGQCYIQGRRNKRNPTRRTAETIHSGKKLNLKGQEDALFDMIVGNAKKLEQLTNSLIVD